RIRTTHGPRRRLGTKWLRPVPVPAALYDRHRRVSWCPPAHTFSFHVIASPAGNYFGGELKPVSIWVSREFARAGQGGTGSAKFGGNYAASLAGQLQGAARGHDQVIFLDRSPDDTLEELGGMNVFFVTNDNKLITPKLTGTILEG